MTIPDLEARIEAILREPYARFASKDSDGAYFATISEFPGCFAIGDTMSSALANLEDVARSWLAACLDRGLEIPPPDHLSKQEGG